MSIMGPYPIGWMGSLVFWLTVVGLGGYLVVMTVRAVFIVEFPYLPEMLHRVLF